MDSLIRWNKEDSRKLEKAINRFNREISQLEKTDFTPPKVKYDELRDRITTRRELETIVKSLNRANSSNLEQTESLASGEKVSSWEFQETIRRKNQSASNLLNELDRINRERAESGNRYMGEERISEIQATLDLLDSSLDDLESFKKSRRRLKTLGRTDFEIARNKQFMENFYTALEGAKNFEHYGDLVKKLKSIRNPNKFYDYVKNSNILMDIFMWYKGDLVYGNFETNEDAFNNALKNELGIEVPLN